MMHKYTLNNAHYFCETADITRPFPSRHAVSDPSWEFVWNRWLAVSLRSQNLAEHCPQLLQVCHVSAAHVGRAEGQMLFVCWPQGYLINL